MRLWRIISGIWGYSRRPKKVAPNVVFVVADGDSTRVRQTDTCEETATEQTESVLEETLFLEKSDVVETRIKIRFR